MKIFNKSKETIVAERVEIADTVVSRLIGLLNRPSLSTEEALIITQCRSIHMFFMKFPIDVLFIDKNNVVIGVVKEIQPFRMSPYFFKASKAIELAAGTVKKTKTEVGDFLEIRE